MTEVLPVHHDDPDQSALEHAADVLRRGGLIVYPTETLYGIGADATNPEALRRIPLAKQRTDRKPILVIVNSVRMMTPYVEAVSAQARELIDTFWPGPLTLVFRASQQVPMELTQGTGTIGIRIPSSQLCLKLLEHMGVPLTSTSANLSGEKPARTVEEISSALKGIDLYLDAGKLPESKPSTVVDVAGEVARVVRSGAIGLDRLREVDLDIQT